MSVVSCALLLEYQTMVLTPLRGTTNKRAPAMPNQVYFGHIEAIILTEYVRGCTKEVGVEM